jgi:hypothetical protein
MVGNELEGYAKTGDDMVKEKMRCSVSGVVESGHSFGPFGEVINGENNVFMTIVEGGLQVIKSMPHLQKGPAVMTG